MDALEDDLKLQMAYHEKMMEQIRNSLIGGGQAKKNAKVGNAPKTYGHNG